MKASKTGRQNRETRVTPKGRRNQAREAAALRANLRKRKAQAETRRETDPCR
ncbi:MAG: hypothetical protein AB1781_10940 [Pseudomonadota bacterium]